MDLSWRCAQKGAASPTPAIETALLRMLGPPTAVVDADEHLVYFHGDSTPYLQQPSGIATLKLRDMLNIGLRPAVCEALRQAVAEKRPITVRAPSARGPDGLEITAGPLRHDLPSEHYYVTFTPRDLDGLSYRKTSAMNELALRLQAQAESANLAKDEFISTVSHELRAPLNTIRLWSRILASGMIGADDVVRGGRAIDRAAFAQQHLIDDLLDISRIATGQLRLTLRAADLAATVTGATETIQPLAEDRQIALSVELGSEAGLFRIDSDRIQQVVLNLLTNAVKFTPAGGRVTVRCYPLDGSTCIEVSDNGVGISPEFLPYVFDRFRRANAAASHRHGGLGLGLSIAKKVIELHGGRIDVRSEGPGRGATFRIVLPSQLRLAEDSTQGSHAMPTSGP